MTTYFEFIQPVGANFTPSTKIHEFARAHCLETFDCYGSTILRFLSGDCRYSHYNIASAQNGLEKVTIYLEEVSHQ